MQITAVSLLNIDKSLLLCERASRKSKNKQARLGVEKGWTKSTAMLNRNKGVTEGRRTKDNLPTFGMLERDNEVYTQVVKWYAIAEICPLLKN